MNEENCDNTYKNLSSFRHISKKIVIAKSYSLLDDTKLVKLMVVSSIEHYSYQLIINSQSITIIADHTTIY
jgi:hypothetical protein